MDTVKWRVVLLYFFFVGWYVGNRDKLNAVYMYISYASDQRLINWTHTHTHRHIQTLRSASIHTCVHTYKFHTHEIDPVGCCALFNLQIYDAIYHHQPQQNNKTHNKYNNTIFIFTIPFTENRKPKTEPTLTHKTNIFMDIFRINRILAFLKRNRRINTYINQISCKTKHTHTHYTNCNANPNKTKKQNKYL